MSKKQLSGRTLNSFVVFEVVNLQGVTAKTTDTKVRANIIFIPVSISPLAYCTINFYNKIRSG